jgi:hypothetical protein
MTHPPSAFPRSYENTAVRDALDTYSAAPTVARIEAVLAAARDGGLAVDVTGSTAESGLRIRTIPSTAGELVLPLFTSLAELGLAVPEDQRDGIQGNMMPAAQALGLINAADFVAVQFDPGSRAVVVKRSLVEAALGLAPKQP